MTTLIEVEELCREVWIAEGLSEKTIYAYLLVARRAERFFDERGVSVLTASAHDVRDLAQTFRRTRSSRVQLRTALARVWEACDRPDGPLGAIRVPSKPKYTCRALSEPDAALLAKFARADKGRMGLAVMLGLYAGLRRNEIACLRWSDLHDDWMTVVGKGEITGQIPIHPTLATRLRAAQCASGSDFVFPGRFDDHIHPTSVWMWTRRLSRAALSIEIPTHVLRHTAIATVNDRTKDLRAAQDFARHASPETTVVYTRVNRERLINAVGTIDY